MDIMTHSPRAAVAHSVVAAPTLDLVIPVHNEQATLARSVLRVRDYLAAAFPFTFRITIADNASVDATLDVALALAATHRQIRVVHLDEKGRGLALRTAWSDSDALVLAYMDVDLSTDLAALLPLIAPLVSGHSDVAIGSRLSRSARVVRGIKREVISRCYNRMLRAGLAARFSDAQCGFKAIRRDVAAQLLPLVSDPGWFFDTELLVLAERSGLRIHEVPVDWVDDPDSRVDIVATALADVRGMWRVGRALASGSLPVAEIRARLGRHPLNSRRNRHGLAQLLRFCLVGAASTAAYLALYLALRQSMIGQAANAVALLATAAANTAVNRRFTFGVAGARGSARHQAQGLVVFALGLGLTSGSLGLLHWIAPAASPTAEAATLIAANLAATLLRFVLFRVWVFADSARERVDAPVEPPAREGLSA